MVLVWSLVICLMTKVPDRCLIDEVWLVNVRGDWQIGREGIYIKFGTDFLFKERIPISII